MSEPTVCLNENHLKIPDGAAALMYVKGRRDNYVAVALPDFDTFAEHGAKYIKEMVYAVNTDVLAACGMCDQVFEAHEKADVSAPDQRKQHYRDVHLK